jgi:hypothetical protein
VAEPSPYARLEAALADVEPPFAVVDLDALRANAADLARRAAGKPIRIASKSIRCRALLREVLECNVAEGERDEGASRLAGESRFLAGEADLETHRVALDPTWNCLSPTPNHFDRIRRAAGAAVSAPKPPSSTVTTTTIGLAGSST